MTAYEIIMLWLIANELFVIWRLELFLFDRKFPTVESIEKEIERMRRVR